VVPMKRLSAAKTRLAVALSVRDREELVCAMLEDVLEALVGSQRIDRVWVVTGDTEFRSLAVSKGCVVTEENTRGGLNGELDLVAKRLSLDGVATMFVVPGDIPCLTSAYVVRILDAHAGAGVTLCPSPEDAGTNVLVASPPAVLPMLFGPQSSHRYLKTCESRGIPCRALGIGELRDIDRPADLSWLRERGRGTRSAAVLESWASRKPCSEAATRVA